MTGTIPNINVFNVSTSYANPLNVIISIVFPASSGGGYYWFVSSYIFLMLLSPFINIVFKKGNQKELLLLLGVLLYISCFSGWIFNNNLNRDGYNVINMIMVYVLGDCLRRFKISDRCSSYIWITIYVLATIAIPHLFASHPSKIFRYNNPLVILAAVSLFCCFAKMKFSSNVVNKLSRVMFPCYLLQE